jgi:hypothetical protein
MTAPEPPDDDHRRPAGIDDATVAALGKLSEAFEHIERARGRLYDFHQMMGHADFQVEDAADALRDAGHHEQAALIRREIVGRNVLDGRWTFQIVEEFDDLYYDRVREVERTLRDALIGGRRHVYEAELKEARRTRALAGHESRPKSAHDARVATDPEEDA